MIRKINESDREIYLQMVTDFYNSDAVLHPVPKQYHINTYNELMRSDEYLLCYMLEFEGESAGYALLSRSFSPEVGGPIVWIEEIFIYEKYRGKGLGTEFFNYMHENLPAARFRLEVEPDNEPAKRLYSLLGYVELPYMQMVKDKEIIE